MSILDIIDWLNNSIANFNPTDFTKFDFTNGLLANPLTVVLWLGAALIALRWVL